MTRSQNANSAVARREMCKGNQESDKVGIRLVDSLSMKSCFPELTGLSVMPEKFMGHSYIT